MNPQKDGGSFRNQITFVKDRAGHVKRYVIDVRKIENKQGWKAGENFESGIKLTVDCISIKADSLIFNVTRSF